MLDECQGIDSFYELFVSTELPNNELTSIHTRDLPSGGSRISCWGVLTRWGGTDLRRIHFSGKTYAKMKEMDPVGGHALVAPPGSANASATPALVTLNEQQVGVYVPKKKFIGVLRKYILPGDLQ